MVVKLFTSFFLVIISFGFVNTHRAEAAGASNINVRPFLEQLTLNPNEQSKEFTLTVSNDSPSTQNFNFSAINFGSLDETGGLAFEGSSIKKINAKYSLAKWLAISPSSIEIPAGQQTDIKVVINNDSSLSPGAHYAAVITTGEAQNQPKSQLTLTPKVSSLIFLTKLGGEKYDIHLESLRHNGNLLNPPTQVSIRFKSTGNTFIIPRGIVSLSQNGKQLSKGIINAQSSIVLPETIRGFDIELNSHISNAGILYTKYQLKVDYRYDGIDHFVNKTISITTINPVMPLLVISIVILGILWLNNRKVNRRSEIKSNSKANR